jgi:sugar phosphate permease
MTTMPLLGNALISTFDWRPAYTILGIVVLVLVIPLAQLLRRDPAQMGLLPDGGERLADSPDPDEEGLSLREAVRTRQLWMVCGMYLTILFCAQTVLVHIVPHSIDLGISATRAAGVASTIGGASIIGRLTMGFSGDRIGHKQGMVVCFMILVTALSWLQFARGAWMLYLFAAVYGFNHGGFFALISPVIAGLFGTRSQGTLLGIVIFCGTIGGSISPILSGAIFDATNSYRIGFIILLVVAVMGLVLTASLKPIGERRSQG